MEVRGTTRIKWWQWAHGRTRQREAGERVKKREKRDGWSQGVCGEAREQGPGGAQRQLVHTVQANRGST